MSTLAISCANDLKQVKHGKELFKRRLQPLIENSQGKAPKALGFTQNEAVRTLLFEAVLKMHAEDSCGWRVCVEALRVHLLPGTLILHLFLNKHGVSTLRHAAGSKSISGRKPSNGKVIGSTMPPDPPVSKLRMSFFRVDKEATKEDDIVRKRLQRLVWSFDSESLKFIRDPQSASPTKPCIKNALNGISSHSISMRNGNTAPFFVSTVHGGKISVKL